MSQERFMVLLDYYQRTAVTTLSHAKVAHDLAFSVSATMEQNIEASGAVIEAVAASHQALTALRGLLGVDLDLPAGPSMAAPIVVPH